MKAIGRALLVLSLSLGGSPTLAQQRPPDPLRVVSQLIGDWTGVAEGEPGVSAASRHVVRVQNGQYVMVEARSVYPKQERNKAGEVHTSLDLWSYDKARQRVVLRQFDSLGFVSTYVEDPSNSTEGRIVLTSEQLQNVPAGWKGRYTYTFVGENEYHELFELDPNGKGLRTYVLGRYLRDRPN